MFNHDFDATILTSTRHRPWPMPDAPWVMTQTWHDLLFAHWPVDAAHLAALVPRPFEIDLCDGAAWLGIVPFHMTNVAPRGVPSVPWLSRFAEMNVRTYVRVGDRGGVYFFSLDAASRVAVTMARAALNLPYYTARMAVTTVGDRVDYRSVRRGAGTTPQFEAVYEPVGERALPRPGTLEHFLTERYCLYHRDHRGVPYRLEIHHPPWPLQPAAAVIRRNSMGEAAGVKIGGTPPLLHFAKRQDMVAWMPSAIR